MGPPENLTDHPEYQAGRRRRSARRPRARCCLLKGCEQPFHPRQANQRYCCGDCRIAARKWSRWKAQQRYRTTKAGKAKRTDQSRRYRERVKNCKPPEPAADNAIARVITPKDFFRPLLRSARLLRGIHTPAAKPLTALLLARVPSRHRAGPSAGASLETGAGLKPGILIRKRIRPYIQPDRCNWSFTSSTVAGSTCECSIRGGSGACWHPWQRAASRSPSSWSRPMASQTIMW